MFGLPGLSVRDQEPAFEIDAGEAGHVDAAVDLAVEGRAVEAGGHPIGGVAAAQIGGELVARPVRGGLQLRRHDAEIRGAAAVVVRGRIGIVAAGDLDRRAQPERAGRDADRIERLLVHRRPAHERARHGQCGSSAGNADAGAGARAARYRRRRSHRRRARRAGCGSDFAAGGHRRSRARMAAGGGSCVCAVGAACGLALGGALGIGVRSGRRRARQPAAAPDLRPYIAGIETGGAGPHPGLVAEILRRPARRGGVGEQRLRPAEHRRVARIAVERRCQQRKIGGVGELGRAGAPASASAPISTPAQHPTRGGVWRRRGTSRPLVRAAHRAWCLPDAPRTRVFDRRVDRMWTSAPPARRKARQRSPNTWLMEIKRIWLTGRCQSRGAPFRAIATARGSGPSPAPPSPNRCTKWPSSEWRGRNAETESLERPQAGRRIVRCADHLGAAHAGDRGRRHQRARGRDQRWAGRSRSSPPSS